MIIVTHKQTDYDPKRGYIDVYIRKCFSDDNVQSLQKHLDELTEKSIMIQHY